MERVRRGVEADVGGDAPSRGQALGQAGRGRVEDASPFEVVEEPGEAPGRGRWWARRSCSRHTEVAGTVWGPAWSGRSGVHSPHGIVPPVMQTSLSRRQRRRRSADRRRPRGSGAATVAVIALPLLLFTTLLLAGAAGAAASVGAYSYLAKDLEDPKAALDKITFTQQTTVVDRTGEVLLARLGDDRREVVTFDQIPPILIDATTSVEDKTFWDNSGFDPAGFVSAAIDTIAGRDRGGSTITQQLVRARLLPQSAFTGGVYERKAKEIIQSIRLTQAYPGGGGQEGDHGEVPQPELLRQPQLRRRRGGPELLEEGPQGPDARRVRAARRHPAVPHQVRPRQERGRGDLHRRQGRRADAAGGAHGQRDRGPPRLHPGADEDQVGAHGRHVHRRRLRGGQAGAGHPGLPGGGPVACAAVRVAGPLRARADPVRRGAVREDRHGRLPGDHDARLPDAAHRREVGLRGGDHPQLQEPGQAAQGPGDPAQRVVLDQVADRPQHPQRGGRRHRLPHGRDPRLRGLGVVHRQGQQEVPAPVRRPRGRVAPARLVDQAARCTSSGSTTRR